MTTKDAIAPETLLIRAVTRDELDHAIGLAADEGWNPGLDDRDAFHAADPDGFIMAFLDGEPVACISAVRYADEFGFVGFYICRPDMRGRGIGLRVWEAAMARLEGLAVGLDGVVDQQDNYRKSGFEYAHRNVRFRGSIDAPAPGDPDIGPVTSDDIDDLVAYDRQFFPAARDAFLRAWLESTATRSGLVLWDNGGVAGYGVIRRCGSGHKIGPLFVSDPDRAEALFLALAAQAKGEPVILDVPEPNIRAAEIARRYRMVPVFETARMYRGATPDLPLEKIFGITTFELG